jgi:V/A-type H+/Na+-transporting ATPase subunit I
MIVAMKKVFLLLQTEHAQEAMGDLAAYGVVHVEHQNPPVGIELNEINEKMNIIEQALIILSAVSQGKNHQTVYQKIADPLITAHHIIDLQKRFDHLKEYSVTLHSLIDQWEPWGDFDPQRIKELMQSNIYVKLYHIPKEQLKNLPKDIIVKKIISEGLIEYCAIFSHGQIALPFLEVELPKTSLSWMQQRLAEDAQVMLDLKQQLSQQLCFYDALAAEKKLLVNQKDFYEVLKGMGQAEKLVYLKGYIPIDTEEKLVKQAQQNSWGIWTCLPKDDDQGPTLVRNPAWIALIQPLLKLLELVPGYAEIDISPLFIIFFSLFFGMLIGDAGYGIVYFLLNFWLYKKFGHKIKDKSAFFLFYILSFCAIIWGLLTATFFGQEWLLNLGIKPLIPALGNTAFIQALCFFIGAVHLTLAHGWRAILKAPALIALADLGWICIIWTVFFLAKNLILGDIFPAFGNGLLIAGLILVLFFTSPQKNIFKTIGEGLGTIALGLVNNFTDVVSYIRLFAVGLAGVAIADAFNAMAAGVFRKGDWLTIIAAALIVIFGHALNIILGPMSVLVHGVRLNVLEFCSHANVTWNGFVYKPFGRKE